MTRKYSEVCNEDAGTSLTVQEAPQVGAKGRQPPRRAPKLTRKAGPSSDLPTAASRPELLTTFAGLDHASSSPSQDAYKFARRINSD